MNNIRDENNIKIYVITEDGHESQITLKEKVQDILKKVNVEIRKEDIMAILRLPTITFLNVIYK